MKPKLFTLSCSSGMTLIELLVASTLSLLIVGMTMTATLAQRDAYRMDIVRTRLNQNIRSAFDVINQELRQAGERLPGSFPAIEIIDGEDGASDELVVRRNLIDEVLTVCGDIAENTSVHDVYLTSSVAGAPPACVFGTQSASFTSFQTFREAQDGDTARAYIYDVSAHVGEYFEYDSELSSDPDMIIHRASGSWENSYTAAATSVYLLNEWRFRMSEAAGQTDLLELIVNEEDDEPRNIVYGVQNLQFQALMSDGTEQDEFTTSDDWSELRAVRVTITGVDTFEGQQITSTLTAELFPRNILSN